MNGYGIQNKTACDYAAKRLEEVMEDFCRRYGRSTGNTNCSKCPMNHLAEDAFGTAVNGCKSVSRTIRDLRDTPWIKEKAS